MPASTLDFPLEQGANFALTLTLKQPKGLPVDLTGYTGKSQLKKEHTDTEPLVDFTVDITEPTQGKVVLSLTSEQTKALNFINGVYDVFLTSPDEVTVRIIEGKVKFSPEVTN